MDVNAESKPVFRANDVDGTGRGPDMANKGAARPARGDAQVTEPKSERRISRVHSIIAGNGHHADVEPSGHGSEIPTYDLAENILAEHRRTAALRRKAPTRVPARPKTPAAQSTAKPPVASPIATPKAHVAPPLSSSRPPETRVETRRGGPLSRGRPAKAGSGGSAARWPLRDLSELQRVVAEIVARDVERLCRQLSGPSCT